jgi:hypothetical protein
MIWRDFDVDMLQPLNMASQFRDWKHLYIFMQINNLHLKKWTSTSKYTF